MAHCCLLEVEPCVVQQIPTTTPQLSLPHDLELLGCDTLICWMAWDVLCPRVLGCSAVGTGFPLQPESSGAVSHRGGWWGWGAWHAAPGKGMALRL